MARKFTRRQVATVFSVLYLGLLTGLAAYALHTSHKLSLPIPSSLTSLTLALPLVAGIAIETSTALAASLSTSSKYSRRHASNIPAVLLPSTLTILCLLIYATVIASLAGTHMSPVGGLGCALREKWERLFRSKQGQRLKVIQDALQCCGFRGTRDMPFPFPSAHGSIGLDECVRRSPERAGVSCEEGWLGTERFVAGILMAVAVGTFLWMAVIIAIPAIQPAWARESLRLPPLDDVADAEQQAQRRIVDYQPYSDDPGETEQDRQDRLREIASLNNDSRLALHIESSRDHPSRLMREAGRNEWADHQRGAP